MVQATVTFISGGARSGKSAYAERLLVNKQAGRLVYIASGVASDSEMKQRIDKHKEDRKDANWQTIEQRVNLHEILPFLKPGDLVLWDCLTTWLANELYEGFEQGTPCVHRPGCLEQKQQDLLHTIKEIKEVAEKINRGEGTLGKLVNELHQQIVELADTAIEMDHGIPIIWKGDSL